MERVLDARVFAPRADNPAAFVKGSAAPLSCDEAKSQGSNRGPCLSISVTALGVFLPFGPVTLDSTAH